MKKIVTTPVFSLLWPELFKPKSFAPHIPEIIPRYSCMLGFNIETPIDELWQAVKDESVEHLGEWHYLRSKRLKLHDGREFFIIRATSKSKPYLRVNKDGEYYSPHRPDDLPVLSVCVADVQPYAYSGPSGAKGVLLALLSVTKLNEPVYTLQEEEILTIQKLNIEL